MKVLLSYYFVFVATAWAVLTIALHVVSEVSALSMEPLAESVAILALGGALWLLLAHEARRGLGARLAYLVITAALWGLTFWLVLDWSSWTGSVPGAIGMLRIFNVTVFIPVAILTLALGLRWPFALPAAPLLLTFPLVVNALFEVPWWLLGAIAMWLSLNSVLGRISAPIPDRSARAARTADLAFTRPVSKLLTCLGAIATLMLLATFGFGIYWEGQFFDVLFYFLLIGPLAFMTGLGLWTLATPEG